MSALMTIQIAALTVKDSIPKDKPLEERIAFAMCYVRKHEPDIFWMAYEVNDDMMMRTALAAVVLAGNDDDKEMITRSLKPLQALSALFTGVPVNMSAVDVENVLPLMKIWHDSKDQP